MAKENLELENQTLRGIIADRDKALAKLRAELEETAAELQAARGKLESAHFIPVYVGDENPETGLRFSANIEGENPDATTKAITEELGKAAEEPPVFVHREGAVVETTLDQLSPYELSRLAFNDYATMDGEDLPVNPVSALQTILHRWEAREFQGGGSATDATLGTNEETGELSEAFIMLAAMQCGAGRMCHAILKRKQGIRGFDDPEVYKQHAADAIADVAIFAMQCSTKLRLDFWKIVEATAYEVMERDWSKNPSGS